MNQFVGVVCYFVSNSFSTIERQFIFFDKIAIIFSIFQVFFGISIHLKSIELSI